MYHQHKATPVFGKKVRDRYDSEVFYTDLWIGKLLEHMKKQSWWDKTVVIVSADHGEAFGEHNMYRHAFELWEMLVHVPLMFCGPNIQARRIESPRSSIDFAPTIVELMGVKAANDFVGESLKDHGSRRRSQEQCRLAHSLIKPPLADPGICGHIPVLNFAARLLDCLHQFLVDGPARGRRSRGRPRRPSRARRPSLRPRGAWRRAGRHHLRRG